MLIQDKFSPDDCITIANYAIQALKAGHTSREIEKAIRKVRLTNKKASADPEKEMLNEAAINADLDNCWAVVAEAIQTILRREAYPHPYEALKALTRTNQAITEKSIKDFIEGLDVSEAIKAELRTITPHTYTGI